MYTYKITASAQVSYFIVRPFRDNVTFLHCYKWAHAKRQQSHHRAFPGRRRTRQSLWRSHSCESDAYNVTQSRERREGGGVSRISAWCCGVWVWQYYAAIGETIAARSSNCSGSAHLSVTWPVAMTFDAEARLLSPPRTHETATNWRLIHAFVAFVSIVQNLISNRNRCTHTDI